MTQLTDYLELVATVAPHSVAAFVLNNGRNYRIEPESYVGPRAPVGQCFKNAADMVMTDRTLTYVEGYMLCHGVPLEHAWITRNGHMLDPTLLPGEATEYFGVPFTRAYLFRAALECEYYGLLGWKSKVADLVDGKIPDAVDCNQLHRK